MSNLDALYNPATIPVENVTGQYRRQVKPTISLSAGASGIVDFDVDSSFLLQHVTVSDKSEIAIIDQYDAAETVINDPYRTQTVLLLNGDSFNDGSDYNQIITNNNVVLTSNEGRDVGSSFLFNGVDSYLSVAINDNLRFFSGDFTLELDCYGSSNNNFNGLISLSQDGGLQPNGWFLEYSSSRGLLWANNVLNSATGEPNPGDRWDNIMVAKQGNTLVIWHEGTIVGTFTDNQSYDLSGYELLIGAARTTGGAVSYHWQGQIQRLRITKGVARQTTNFPVVTTPLTLQTITGNTTYYWQGIIEANLQQWVGVIGEATGLLRIRVTNLSGNIADIDVTIAGIFFDQILLSDTTGEKNSYQLITDPLSQNTSQLKTLANLTKAGIVKKIQTDVTALLSIYETTNPALADPYWSDVVLLLRGYEQNGDSDVTGRHIITLVNGVTNVTNPPPGSNLNSVFGFNGTDQYATLAPSPDWQTDVNSPFSLEGRFYIDSSNASNTNILLGTYESNINDINLLLWVLANGDLEFVIYQLDSSPFTNQRFTHSINFTYDQWHDVGISYDGTNFYLDLDGDIEILLRTLPSFTVYNSKFWIGAYHASTALGGFLKGYAGNIRFTQNVARHVGNYTPELGIFPTDQALILQERLFPGEPIHPNVFFVNQDNPQTNNLYFELTNPEVSPTAIILDVDVIAFGKGSTGRHQIKGQDDIIQPDRPILKFNNGNIVPEGDQLTINLTSGTLKSIGDGITTVNDPEGLVIIEGGVVSQNGNNAELTIQAGVDRRAIYAVVTAAITI